MYRLSWLAQLVIILVIEFIVIQGPASAQIRVALVIGDTQSAAAISAIHQLKSSKDLHDLDIRCFTRDQPSTEERIFLCQCNIAIVYPRYATLVRSVLPELRTLIEQGQDVYAVGPTIEPEFEQAGIRRDPVLSTYFEAGGVHNLEQMVRAALKRKVVPNLNVEPPESFPEFGYFDCLTGRPIADFMLFETLLLKRTASTALRKRVGIYFSREQATGGQTELIMAIARALELRGLDAIPAFGYPSDEAIEKLYLDESGQSRIDALVGVTLKIGNVPEKLEPLLSKLDVPIINAIALNSQNLKQWQSSAAGLDLMERSWQIGAAELAGAVAPTIVASKERVIDAETGLTYALTLPIAERVERLAQRVEAWVRLRDTKPQDRRVALIYYNYPPGKESVGASYLNVLPHSLLTILQQMRTDGHNLGQVPNEAESLFDVVRTYGSNPKPGFTAARAIRQLVESKRVQTLAVSDYRQWFDELPEQLRMQIVNKWGEPEDSRIMVWTNEQSEKHFVFPAQIYGNVLLAPQPTRGWDDDVSAIYHDVTLPPHHQYLAFYLWLQKTFQAHCVVHVGTHATHEWLPGKEVGFGEADTGEVIAGSTPQLYIYIVDDIGEALQAKRRGMATMISHLTPPMDLASLAPELREISGLINDLSVAKEKGSLALTAMQTELRRRCEQHGLFKDLGIQLDSHQELDDEQIEAIEHHLKRIGERLTPFGMHTFGRSPSSDRQQSTATAIASLDKNLGAPSVRELQTDIVARIDQSGPAELRALSAGLAGRYIAAGLGNDPVRNPAALPTGKNIFGFDPARLPTQASYAEGSRLAHELIKQYQQRHSGESPDRLVFNLWGTETSRHEGVMEAQILALMGVKPIWDSRGRAQSVALIDKSQLSFPRVDVTIIPSGLYRDLFPKLMLLMDQAVTLVKEENDADNALLRNIARMKAELIQSGVDEAEADKLASVRMFSVPSGAYGAGLEHAIQHEDSWTDDTKVSDVYFNRMSHLFGQGYWGLRARSSNRDLSPALLKGALRDAKAVIHSRSSNVYGAIDSDDFYQYLGGTAMAVRAVNGQPAETWVSDLSNPKSGENVTLDRYLGQEMKARYLNPKWIDSMLNEGYAGARMLRQVTDNLWGWQVTVPESIDANKWQEMYEVYVKDRHNLKIRERIETAENLAAYDQMLRRMQSVIKKGYWTPEESVSRTLDQLRQELLPHVQSEHQRISQRAEETATPDAAPASAAKDVTMPSNPVPALSLISGYAVEAVKLDGSLSSRGMQVQSLASVCVISLLLIILGWKIEAGSRATAIAVNQSNSPVLPLRDLS